MNNLKQIALGLVIHENAHGSFPAAGVEAAEGSQLSWRVHILPYIYEQTLYEQFHLDEPWDSEHNRALIDKMPRVFENPGAGFPVGETSYLAVTGTGTTFGDGTKGPALPDFTDGLSNTVLVIEADTSVPWTKPDDWQLDPNGPRTGLGKLRRRGFLAGFADAKVHFIDDVMPADAVKALMTQGDRVNFDLD
jgi:hypothetical protein